jgi:hypothetical protein
MFEIDVVEECGINGSLLDLMLDCTSHVRNAEIGCPIPGSHIKDVFSYHYTNNDVVGLVVNAPGELTGKITNHVNVFYLIVNFKHLFKNFNINLQANFLHQLKRCEIPPSKVIYISHGVEIGKKGVKKNFTKLSGDQLLETSKILMKDGQEVIPECNLPKVNGFLSGMTNGKNIITLFISIFLNPLILFIDATSRLLRNLNDRKFKA